MFMHISYASVYYGELFAYDLIIINILLNYYLLSLNYFYYNHLLIDNIFFIILIMLSLNLSYSIEFFTCSMIIALFITFNVFLLLFYLKYHICSYLRYINILIYII